jgi:hypothetical protein
MKKKVASIHDKAVERMEREVNRAKTSVEMLDKLYREMVESKQKENK